MDRTLLPPLSIVWRDFAAEIGAHYDSGDFWSAERIEVRRGSSRLTIAQETVGPGVSSLPVTAWRARSAELSAVHLFLTRADVSPGPVPGGARYRIAGCERYDLLLALPWLGEAMAGDDLLSISVDRHDVVVIVAGSVWLPDRLLFYTELTLALLDARVATPSERGGEGSPTRTAPEER